MDFVPASLLTVRHWAHGQKRSIEGAESGKARIFQRDFSKRIRASNAAFNPSQRRFPGDPVSTISGASVCSTKAHHETHLPTF